VSLYGCVLIARKDVTQQQFEGIADSFASQLEVEGGVDQEEPQGHYILLGPDAKSGFVTEIERQLS
jgi:small subunit ribosomal protein S6